MKILLGGAGGAPANNVIKSLREGGSGDRLIGLSSVPSDLLLADVDERHLVPYAVAEDYPRRLAAIIRQTHPDFFHAQHDFEVRAVSRLRAQLQEAGVRLYLPDALTVENTVDKGKSYEIWKRAGVPVPDTLLLSSPADLQHALDRFGGQTWLRATEGGGGKGALPVRGPQDYEFARLWIERFKGWGQFTAAELLTADSVTWLSIWFQGELVVAQTRRRRSWNFGDRTLSGVTGVTGVGETCSSEIVTRTALDAIEAVDAKAHGIFAVDMTYDTQGKPRVTEINIGRFFTTVYFFTRAGVNFPQIYRDIALEEKFPVLKRKINPLPDGLLWIRGMDVEPVLTTAAELESLSHAGRA
jgi:glutathione synthase/RimK-type ligase-like ATP-grasp enzyme